MMIPDVDAKNIPLSFDRTQLELKPAGPRHHRIQQSVQFNLGSLDFTRVAKPAEALEGFKIERFLEGSRKEPLFERIGIHQIQLVTDYDVRTTRLNHSGPLPRMVPVCTGLGSRDKVRAVDFLRYLAFNLDGVALGNPHITALEIRRLVECDQYFDRQRPVT